MVKDMIEITFSREQLLRLLHIICAYDIETYGGKHVSEIKDKVNNALNVLDIIEGGK